jgi:predicted nucleic acid-binding protein
MEKVFLDANILIDLVEKRKNLQPEDLASYDVFITPLSAHILMYVTRQKVPYPKFSEIIKPFSVVMFDEIILKQSLAGPTDDFEDNVQLHSAAEGDCDIFLTEDRKLLNMRFFGKVRIVPTI